MGDAVAVFCGWSDAFAGSPARRVRSFLRLQAARVRCGGGLADQSRKDDDGDRWRCLLFVSSSIDVCRLLLWFAIRLIRVGLGWVGRTIVRKVP